MSVLCCVCNRYSGAEERASLMGERRGELGNQQSAEETDFELG